AGDDGGDVGEEYPSGEHRSTDGVEGIRGAHTSLAHRVAVARGEFTRILELGADRQQGGVTRFQLSAVASSDRETKREVAPAMGSARGPGAARCRADKQTRRSRADDNSMRR